MKLYLDQDELTKAIATYLAIRGYQLKGEYRFSVIEGEVEYVTEVEKQNIGIDNIINFAKSEDRYE